ncbi:MAG TPA: signal peptidase I [Rhizomicrobium sp.]
MGHYFGFLWSSLTLNPGGFLLAAPDNRRPFLYLSISSLLIAGFYFAFWPYDPLSLVYLPSQIKLGMHLLERLSIGVPAAILLLVAAISAPLFVAVVLTSGLKHAGKLVDLAQYVFSSVWLVAFASIFCFALLYEIGPHSEATPFAALFVVAYLMAIFYRFLTTFLGYRRLLAAAACALYIVGIGTVQFYFVLKIARVQDVIGNGMSPGLADGTFFIASRWSYDHQLVPARGDIVTYWKVSPLDAANGNLTAAPILHVKRVIGLPGDTVQIVAGRIYLNGIPARYAADSGFRGTAPISMSRPSVRPEILSETFAGIRHTIFADPEPLALRDVLDNTKPSKLGACEYYLLGDNRSTSYDSRTPTHGVVHCAEIDGIVVGQLFPLFRDSDVTSPPVR